MTAPVANGGKDYVLQIRVRNARLMRAMRAAGFITAVALSRASGVSQAMIGQYLALALSPINADGDPRPSAESLCRVLRRQLDEIFPPQHLEQPLRKSNAEVEVSLDDIQAITGQDLLVDDRLDEAIDDGRCIGKLLQALRPRDRDVVTRRFGLDGDAPQDLRDIARDLDLSPVRIQQIERRAIRRMRIEGQRVGPADEALE